MQAEKIKQEFVHNNEITKIKEENKALRDQIARFDEERLRLEEEVRQAFTQGKRQAVIEMAKMKAKSIVKVGTQTDKEPKVIVVEAPLAS